MTRKGAAAAAAAAGGEHAPSSARFVCSMCAKVYRSGAGLRYHKRKRHRGMVEPTALHRVKCQEFGCTYQMLAISDLRNHLSNHHQKPEYKCTEEKKFTTLADFTEWKSTFESSTGSKYVKNCGAKGKSDNQTTEYYYCNRTGPYGQGLRRNKAQGALRGGIHCTSSMKVEIQNDEHITVQYYPAHYGHSNAPASSDDHHPAENTMSNNSNTTTSNSGVTVHHPQTRMIHTADRSPSSSPGSASTSPSGGSNSNSNHPQVSNERYSLPPPTLPPPPPPPPTPSSMGTGSSIKTHMHNTPSNHMSHCIIITPSLMLEEHPSLHSNDHHTPVLVVQQHLSATPSTVLVQPSANLNVKKETRVSDIMHEAFQLLSYWPLDHPQSNFISSEYEQQVSHSHFNMDEHLMF